MSIKNTTSVQLSLQLLDPILMVIEEPPVTLESVLS